MTKRSISDMEIALIKAMLDRGMKNSDIQLYFNRPDRKVNSGRISGISTGSYSNSAEICPATEHELDEFMEAFKPWGVDEGDTGDDDPLSEKTIRAMFKELSPGSWQLSIGETDQHECKTSFGFKHATKWLRAAAGLANNRGGYIFFGVNDLGHKGPSGVDEGHMVVGMTNEEFQADPKEFAVRMKSAFDPTPRFRIRTLAFGARKVGVIHVEQHPSRPVISVRTHGALKEGEILFRYPGRTEAIKYSDLRAIFDERDAKARADILPMVERLLRIGPANAMIADLRKGELSDDKRAIALDPELLSKMVLIKEGEFTETAGQPALRLVGDVKAASSDHIAKGVITSRDVVNDFLAQTCPLAPSEYVRFMLEGTSQAWLPLHYYASKSGLEENSIEELIDALSASSARKALVRNYFRNSDAAYKAPQQPQVELLELLADGESIPVISTPKEVRDIARALISLHRNPPQPFEHYLKVLKGCAAVPNGGPTSLFGHPFDDFRNAGHRESCLLGRARMSLASSRSSRHRTSQVLSTRTA